MLRGATHRSSLSLKEVIFHSEEIPLTNAQIEHFSPKTHVVLYEELSGAGLQQLLGPNGQYILLYQFPDSDLGHWVCGWADDDGVHHFDPYGNPPDYYTKDTLYSSILATAPRLSSNPHRVQAKGDAVATCGRHCLVRLMFRDHSDQEYADLMAHALSLRSPDELVTAMTLNTTLHDLEQ